jgi:hypothetical protein
MLHRRQKCILHGVIGVRGFAEYCERDPVRRADVAVHERLERRGVAVLCAGDEYGVRRLHSLLG